MGKLKFYLALLVGKSTYTFLRLTRLSSGTSIIGKIALKFCPEFLNYANDYIKCAKVNITGTNGKTTTSGLLTHLIKSSGCSVINNSLGANMLTGVVNTLVTEIKLLKKMDYSVLESDEAYLEKIYENLDADYLLVTNLFRDQLDRYGELATTKRLIQNAIDKKDNLTLLLNADDPLVASFEGKGKAIYYGIDSITYADLVPPKESSVEESFACTCGKTLRYIKKFYAQQGHYYCDCGYSRPQVKYSADVVLHKNYSVLKLNNNEYKVPLVGLFNAYNALGAISLALELEIEDIQKNLESFQVAFGRSEVKYLNGKRTLIQLIKNPIGANEVLKTVDLSSNILIIINDNYADGRDVSWLWDAEFESIKESENQIVVSGMRAHDMALRLKYAGVQVDKIKVIEDVKKAVNYVGKSAKNDITILPTYTALLKIDKMKILKRRK